MSSNDDSRISVSRACLREELSALEARLMDKRRAEFAELELRLSLSLASQVQITDHEKRLRMLERWRYTLPATLITSSCVIIISIVLSLSGG